MDYCITVGTEQYRIYPLDVIAEILKAEYKVVRNACLKDKIQAVITVPATFNQYSVQELLYATEIAGFEVTGVYPEPIAAAYSILDNIICHNFLDYLEFGKEYNLIVYDFGGFTFDCVFLHVNNGTYKVLSYASRESVGGFYIAKELVESIAPDTPERAKYTYIRQCMSQFGDNVQDIYLPCGMIPRSAMNSCIERYVHTTEEIVDAMMHHLKPGLETYLFMVGGMCTCNLVQKEVMSHFNSKSVVNNTFLYDVARGAMLLGESLFYAHNCALQIESSEREELLLPYDVVITVGVQETRFYRNQNVLGVSQMVEVLGEQLSTVLSRGGGRQNRPRIRCYYDYPNRPADKYIINEVLYLYECKDITYKCTIDSMKCLKVVSTSEAMEYRKSYFGFILVHSTPDMKEEHERRISDVVNAFRRQMRHGQDPQQHK